MYTVLQSAMPWLFNVISQSPVINQNGSYAFSPADGTVPTVVPLRGTVPGSQIKITWLGGSINNNGPAGNGFTAPSGSPLSSVPYFEQQLVGAWTDANGNVLATVNLQNVQTSPQTLTIPAGAAQLQLGVNWGGGTSFLDSVGYWVFGVTGIAPPTASGTPGLGKLVMNELQIASFNPLTVTGGLIDESARLHYGEGPKGLGGQETTDFHTMLKQRGTANIAVNVPAGDNWQPQKGWQVFLYDVSAVDQDCVFAGTIETIQTSWWGENGDRLLSLSCTSFEQCADVVRIYPGRLYQSQTAGYIFADLLTLLAGSPIVAGNIAAGPVVDTFLVDGFPTVAETWTKLCQLEAVQFVWTIDPGSQQVNFGAPGAIPAPFTVMEPDVIYEAFDLVTTRQDFRDRQILTLEADAFGRSAQLFTGQNQVSFVLQHPVKDVTNAWITNNTQNTAIGTMTGIPKAGDSVTIGYPASGSIYNWAKNSQYAVGQIIIDPNGHTQKVTTSVAIGNTYGLSGGTQPAWNDNGGVTVDNQLRWTDQGVLPFGPYQAGTYYFVETIDNTQWGQVLIASTLAQCLQNLVDAINAQDTYEGPPLYSTPQIGKGYGFSYPTWENTLVSADSPVSGVFTLRNKYAGKGFVAALSASSSAFSWSAAQTSGGITTFGTQSISVGPATAQVQGLSYTPGSPVVTLFSPLNATIGSGVATNLQVEYHRLDGDAIIVEDTSLVEARAAIEDGTGKYQALTSDTAANQGQGLTEANNGLSAYKIMPETLEFQTFCQGFKINQLLAFGFNMPDGPDLEAPDSNSEASIILTVTIDPTKCGGADSPGFTVCFTGTYAELRNLANGGYVTSASGYDIVFTSDAAGDDLLTWEVVEYNPVTGFIIAWVRIANLSASQPTIFYVQAGNPGTTTFQGGAVGSAWSDYNVVLHLPNGSVLTTADSSGNGNNASVAGGTSASFGVIDGGAAFDGSSGYLSAPNQVTPTQGSVEVWAYTVVAGNSTVFLMGVSGGVGSPWPPAVYAEGIGIHVVAWLFGTSNIALGFPAIWDGWNLLSISWSQSENFARLTINNAFGSQQVSAISYDPTVTIPSPYPVAGAASWAGYWPGNVSEFRMSGVPRSTAWMIARYNNETSPSTFYSVSAGAQWIIQEVQGELIPTNTDLGKNSLGHHYGQMRYTVRGVNLAQYGSFLDFWEGLGGGSGGISGNGSANTPNYSGTPAAQSPAYGSQIGGVNEQSGNYTIQTSDNGVLVVANASGGSPAISPTFKLPAAPPSGIWWCAVSNIGMLALTLDPNGLLLDGVAYTLGLGLLLSTNEGLFVYTDGTNYFTDRGIPGVTVSVNDSVIATERGIDFESGIGATVSAVDDPANGRVKVTVAAKGYTASWSAQTSVTVTHGLGTFSVIVQVYDSTGNLTEMSGSNNVQITGANTVQLTFGSSFTGFVVIFGFVSAGGTGATIVASAGVKQTNFESTSPITTSSVNTTGANVIVLACGGIGSGFTVTDSKSNIWTSIAAEHNAAYSQMFYCENPTTSATHTFTCTNNRATMAMIAIGSLPPLSALDASSGASGSSTGTITPSQGGDIFVVMGACDDVNNASVPAGFTSVYSVNGVSAFSVGLSLSYFLQGPASPLNPNTGMSSATAIGAAFKSV